MCVCVCAGEGAAVVHARLARCRKERGRYSWAGAGSPGELRYAASQRHTEPSLRREFHSQGWRSRAGASQALLPGQVTLGKSATHSGPVCPPSSLGLHTSSSLRACKTHRLSA